jgi:D-methionine transport system ATP-binding protein
VEHTLDLELPERLLKDIRGTLIKVVYQGDKAEEPVISDTLRKHAVRFNVLHGKIEYINGRPLGVLLLDATGDKEELLKSVEYLKTRTASVEVLHG